jgi:putative peptidoglycan lipid II flippase
VLITILGIFCSPWIVRIIAWGFGSSGEKYELTVLLTRITFPYILLIGIVALFMGVLNSLRRFASPAAAPILLNVGMIGGAVLISPYLSQPIIGLAFGVIIGGILQVCLQIPWVLKSGISLCPVWMPYHPAVKRIGLLMLPAIFGSAIYQFNQFMGTLLASLLQEGSISWLYYADRLVQFPLGIFAISISTAALPSLSRHVTEKNFNEFKETLDHSLKMTFFITIPSMVGLIVLGRPIIQLIFEGGVFDSKSTLMSAKALMFYSVGLWAFAGVRVPVSAFYAFQDTKTPVRIAVVAMIANLLFSLILMRLLEHAGLALALSLASTIQFCLLIVILRLRLDEWNLYPIFLTIIKCLVSSIIMGIVVYLIYFRLITPKPSSGVLIMTLSLFGVIIIGVITYFIVSRIVRCSETSYLIDMFRSLIRTDKGR